MAQITRMADGAYRLSRMAMFFTVSRRILDGAVPRELSGGTFGWMRGALPAPDASGCYLVEFLDRCTVRVLGYVDRQGGVFATNEAQSDPFEGDPILKFEHFPQEEGSSVERGCVEISAEDGRGGKKPHVAIVAHYECADGRFALQDSWFDFGAFSRGLTYEDALARCFFAFVHRCNLGGLRITECGFDGIDHALRRSSLVRALRHIVEGTRRAEAAPGVEPPALVRHLARWLDDAHVLELALRGDELNLVQSVDYSGLYYIVPGGEGSLSVSGNDLAAIEAALDAFKIMRDRLGERAFAASMDEVAQMASEVRSLAVSRIPCATTRENRVFDSRAQAENAFDLPVYDAAVGEWSWRSALSTMLESTLSPHRVVVDFRGGLDTGSVAMVGVVPCYKSMPLSRWDADAHLWQACSIEERRQMAERYALSCAISCIADAFASSERIMRVNFLEGFLDSDSKLQDVFSSKDAVENAADRGFGLKSFCRISVDRDTFCRDERYLKSSGDPLSFWMQIGGELLYDAPVADMVDGWPDALELLRGQVEVSAATDREDYPEVFDGLLPEDTRAPLGARYMRDLRITYSSRWRRNAERLADALTAAESDVDSIRIARTMQQKATDPFDVNALTRVMSALVDGSLDTADQNAIVNCYLGEDAYLGALAAMRGAIKEQRGNALSSVIDAIDEAERTGRFADTAEVVYRGFDTYASRLLYNLIRTGELSVSSRVFDFGAADAGKRVELVPDSLYMCYSTAAYFAEQDFDESERGIELAKQAIRIAPTVINGYRSLARAYALVGDMSLAKEVLTDALKICVAPPDISLVYYQLAYAYWKSDEPRLAALCYLKSVAVSPVVAQQAAVELHQLMHEEEIPVMGLPEVDAGLRAAGVPLAPDPRLLDAVKAGAAAATDAGMFGPAQTFLSLELHYRPDDALVDVLKSLG